MRRYITGNHIFPTSVTDAVVGVAATTLLQLIMVMWVSSFSAAFVLVIFTFSMLVCCPLGIEVKSAPECDMWGFGTGGGLCVALS
ncbi:unnamed protein product, partial [Prunus brigantina]